MGAHRLSQEIYESMMATYASMPPGHQFQVCLTCTNNLATNVTSQIPPKPCARWVQKILAKEGFRSLRSKKKPLLNKVNRAKRLLFARKYSNFDWSRTIFSDEKIFRVRPGARVRCWVAPNDSRFSPKYLTSSVQKPEGVMVWAAMKSDGAICLRRCPPKMNSAGYQSILGSAMTFIKPRCVITPNKRIFIPFSFTEVAAGAFSKTAPRLTGACPHRPS